MVLKAETQPIALRQFGGSHAELNHRCGLTCSTILLVSAPFVTPLL